LELFSITPQNLEFWGFHPHKLINRHAVFTLPPGMISFYKHHLHFVSEEAVKADHRRYAVPQEAPRHYIDLDYYGLAEAMDWNDLVEKYPRDSIESHGVLPWHLMIVKFQLTKAFKEADQGMILKISADAGHYIADAHVPLHTTSNYNGQFTGQHGVHGFWETRIPELLHRDFDLWVGHASYRNNWYSKIWGIVLESHGAVDSVLHTERNLTALFPSDKKYSYEVRLGRITKVYSEDFSKSYHKALNDQVERKLKASIIAVGDFWYTCWVDAGQPDLARLVDTKRQNSPNKQHFADSLWRISHMPR